MKRREKAAAGEKNLGTIRSAWISAHWSFYHRQSFSGLDVYELWNEKKASRGVDDRQFNDVDSAGC